jgi:hypothetical protein
MADFRLTQTGEQIQAILNQQPLDHTALDGHIENSVIHVTSQNKTDWDAKYNKPSGGIPSSDFTQAVQEALVAALSAYQKPNDGIPASDLAAAVQSAIAKANSAYQKPGSGIPSTDFTTAVQNALTLALSAYQKPNTGIPQSDLSAAVQAALMSAANEPTERQQADAALQLLIQQVTNSLVNYYLKSETYSRAEVNDLVAAVGKFQSKIVSTLPTPSIDTTGWIYLVPSDNPKTQNVKEEYITVLDGSTYKWEHIGSTNIDLSPYSTTEQMNAAIANAIASYYTKTQVDTMVQSINAALAQKASQSDLNSEVSRAQQAEHANAQNIATLDGLVAFINKSFGKYDGQREIVLQQAKSGKYVNTDGGETTASGYSISAPITLNAGDILLIPSAQAVPASVSVVARMVDRTYQKVIAYIYTYRTDYPELPATATADYDSTLVYTAVYDERGDTPVLTGWTRAGQTYTTLPATREVSEQFYEPLVRQAVSAMPSTGYYIYLSPTAMTVVVSGLTATVSGGTALVVGWGIFKNITTNFVGAPGQSVLAQAFAVLFAAIDGLKAQLDNLGETKAVSIDFEEQPKLCGQDMYIVGSGAPASPVVPTMIGQEYLDVTNKKCYKAFSITNSVSDWVLLN